MSLINNHHVQSIQPTKPTHQISSKNMNVRWMIIRAMVMFMALLATFGIAKTKIQNVWEYSFADLPTSSFENPEPMSKGSQSSDFLGGVGGVSFDQTATPQTTPTSLTIHYNPSNPDGNRLNLTINNSSAKVSFPDWLLIPLAKYSDSPYYSCFTLFGKLTNANLEELVLNEGGRVMNYHPALDNTLLGLRMFYMDILIIYPFTYDLPKEAGTCILGLGEHTPDTSANLSAMINFNNWFVGQQKPTGLTYRSYVVTDFGRQIGFNVSNDSLRLTGTPCYFFWMYASDQDGFNEATVLQHVTDSLTQARTAAVSAGTSTSGTWTIDAFVNALKEYEAKHNFYTSGFVVDLIAMPTEAERRTELNLYGTPDLFDYLASFVADMYGYAIVPVNSLKDSLSQHESMIRAINPAVWDATVATMRYSAFFRYCKQTFPAAWNQFMQEIASVNPQPVVTTPTIMYPTGNAAILAALATGNNITLIPAKSSFSVSPRVIVPFGASRMEWKTSGNVFDLRGRLVGVSPVKNLVHVDRISVARRSFAIQPYVIVPEAKTKSSRQKRELVRNVHR